MILRATPYIRGEPFHMGPAVARLLGYFVVFPSSYLLLPVLGQACEYGLVPPTPGSPSSVVTFVDPRNDHMKADAVLADPPPMKVERILGDGDPANRVDLVFFGDGYTAQEENKFFEDALRLAKNITEGQTFSVISPVLNFWAAFTPSKESGIGVGSRPKDTIYGLYRVGTELRGVYYANRAVARAACSSLGTQCDYPILLGNDPYYGGLGGEFTVVTSSFINGPLVLRHELGHNMINVGEEYDGGSAYFGVNSATSPNSLGWGHWLTTEDDADSVTAAAPAIQRNNMPMQAYPWALLNTSASFKMPFDSSGGYESYLIKFSLSGIPEDGDAKVILDGRELEWKVDPLAGLDRWHYDVYVDEPLPSGRHVLEFLLVNRERQGFAQLGNAEVLQYGGPTEFIREPGFYGAYPTYSTRNATTYRPTNEDCLMRRTTSVEFCKVCIEGLWLSVLSQVDFIEDVHMSCSVDKEMVIDLDVLALGPFRVPERPELGEKLHIKWSGEEGEFESARDATTLKLPNGAVGSSGSSVEVEIQFETPQVKMDRRGVLVRKMTIKLPECGAA